MGNMDKDDSDSLKFMVQQSGASVNSVNAIIQQVALFIARWFVIINGTACISLIALIGNTWGKESKELFIKALIWPIVAFGCLSICSLLIAACVYFCYRQIAIANPISYRSMLSVLCPSVCDPISSYEENKRDKSRKWLQIWTWIAIVVSVIIFILSLGTVIWTAMSLHNNFNLLIGV